MRANWSFAAMLLAAAAGSALADDLHFDNPGNNIWWPGSVYVSPYQATDKTLHESLLLYCMDFNHEIDPPQDWVANLWALTPANVPNYQYGGSSQAYNFSWNSWTHQSEYVSSSGPVPSAFTRYEEDAWLFTQSAATSDPVLQQQYQIAAWSLFVDSAHVANFNQDINNSGPAFAHQVDDFVAAAEFNVVNQGWTPAPGTLVVTADPGWVLAGNGGREVQEFIVLTPEPSAIFFLVTILGLLALSGKAWSKTGRAAKSQSVGF